MSTKIDKQQGPLKLQAIYPVPMLARAAGVEPHALLRALRSAGVELVSSGRALLVPLSEIKIRIPNLWRSIVEAERVRAAAIASR